MKFLFVCLFTSEDRIDLGYAIDPQILLALPNRNWFLTFTKMAADPSWRPGQLPVM